MSFHFQFEFESKTISFGRGIDFAENYPPDQCHFISNSSLKANQSVLVLCRRSKLDIFTEGERGVCGKKRGRGVSRSGRESNKQIHPRSNLEQSWKVLETSWRRPGSVLGRLGGVLEASWRRLGAPLASFFLVWKRYSTHDRF